MKPDPLEYIRNTYRVEAFKGRRVRYTGGKEPQEGTITGADGARLKIRLDGAKDAMSYHPTWEMEYLPVAP